MRIFIVGGGGELSVYRCRRSCNIKELPIMITVPHFLHENQTDYCPDCVVVEEWWVKILEATRRKIEI